MKVRAGVGFLVPARTGWLTTWVTASGVSYRDVIITAESNNASALPKNTDFFDSLNVKHLSVERTWVNIGDDCFSPKSNASDVHVDTMYCNGTHGQSMGSIGQYAGEKSIIESVFPSSYSGSPRSLCFSDAPEYTTTSVPVD